MSGSGVLEAAGLQDKVVAVDYPACTTRSVSVVAQQWW